MLGVPEEEWIVGGRGEKGSVRRKLEERREGKLQSGGKINE